MFGMFKKSAPVQYVPYQKLAHKDEEIKQRARQMAQSMGEKYCAAPNSKFKFVPGPTVLK